MQTSPITETATSEYHVDAGTLRAMLSKRSFATLATTSSAGRPHAASVLYELIGNSMYVNTLRPSRKGRNIESNRHVGVSVPIRRLPIGPPSTIHFQAQAELIDLDHPHITALVADGELKSLTGHGELDLPNGCFVRIKLPRRVNTYGLGMSIRKLIADPLSAGGTTMLDATG